MSALSIWMNGEWVGTWSVGRTGNHRLDYAPSWRASARSRPLSLSLPFTADNRLEGNAVSHYFDNLLPDSDGIRKRISARFQTKGTDAFALLQAVGRDCVGRCSCCHPVLPRRVLTSSGTRLSHQIKLSNIWVPWARMPDWALKMKKKLGACPSAARRKRRRCFK